MKRQKTVALIGTLDTKGKEYAFIRDIVENYGHRTLIIDVGVMGEPEIIADFDRSEIAKLGGVTITELQASKDRGKAIATMAEGAEKMLAQLHKRGQIDGVLALGGTGGTSIACRAMRALPLGVPKVMVSTIAGTDVSGYVGMKDIVMIPSIVDVSGINKISREIFTRAALAVCGMTDYDVGDAGDRPLIVASMFGNTTPAVERAKTALERQGFEVLVFHCTGNGGKTMESLIESGMISGVLDITTTELADELVGGVFSAGSDRLGAAARSGIPAVVTPGCLDMVNFWAPETIPEKFQGRLFYRHNPNVTLMRTSVEENRALGRMLAQKLNESKEKVTVLIPRGGVSMIAAPGGPFYKPEADEAFCVELKRYLRDDIPVIELDYNINDPEFADRCVIELLKNMKITVDLFGRTEGGKNA